MPPIATEGISNESVEAQFKEYRHIIEPLLHAYRYTFKGPDWDAIVSDAEFGLFLAIRQFDPARGTPFETYARYKIRKCIQEGFRSRDALSRRARKKGVQVTVTDIDAIDQSAESAVHYTDRGAEQIACQDHVAAMLDCLDEQSRALIQLRFFEHLTIHTISERMGIHPRNVYRKINDILITLRNGK